MDNTLPSRALLVRLVAAVLVLTYTINMASALDECRKINSCSCALDHLELLYDLSSLKKHAGFIDQYGPNMTDLYSFNPCQPFDEKACKNVSMCQIAEGDKPYPLGTQESAQFTYHHYASQLYITYSAMDALNVTRTSKLFVDCEKSAPVDEFIAHGETSPGSKLFTFTLKGPGVCPTYTGGVATKGNNAGVIVVVVLICLIFGYLIGGVFIQAVFRNKRGIEMMPNYTMWAACAGRCKRTSYDEV